MEAFRLARANHRHDLSGSGAFLFGGRWNSVGRALLYTAETRALACLEMLVHLPSSELPADMYLLRLDVPDALPRLTLRPADLPADWQRLVLPYPTAPVGDLWLANQRSVALRVPSVILPDEYNLLLNPNHPDFNQVRLLSSEPFQFDHRLGE